MNVESEVENGNSNGFWDVYLFPGDIITVSDMPTTWSQMDNEDISQYLWGHGLWMASNQTPAHVVFAPMTSRNITKGGRVIARCHVEGSVPALGLNRCNVLMSYFADQ